jgi:coenzyme F420 hydrogenase subunit beta
LSQRKKNFNNLKSEIIDNGKCVSCGACETVCPVNVIELVNLVPTLVGDCIECGICLGNCPSTDFDSEVFDFKIFGRNRKIEEKYTGIYQNVYSAKATPKEINFSAQDGGVVSALLVQFLKDGGEAVIVAGLEKEKIWAPTPVIAKTPKEIIQSAGTKYTVSPTLIGVKKAVKEEKLGNIAVVGTTCQMRALSLITDGPLKNIRLANAIDLKIGLFCMESFNYLSFIEYLNNNNVIPSNVTKFEIKNGRFYAWRGEERLHRARLSKVKKLIRPCCTHCIDFSSEYADISVGNVGSPPGFSTVLIRTDKGRKAFEAAIQSGIILAEEIEEFEKGDTLVHKLAEIKKTSHQ